VIRDDDQVHLNRQRMRNMVASDDRPVSAREMHASAPPFRLGFAVS
jgi:hypothetical protein